MTFFEACTLSAAADRLTPRRNRRRQISRHRIKPILERGQGSVIAPHLERGNLGDGVPCGGFHSGNGGSQVIEGLGHFVSSPDDSAGHDDRCNDGKQRPYVLAAASSAASADCQDS